MFFSRSIDLCLGAGVFPGEGWWKLRVNMEPQGLDTDIDDILHPEDKEEVPSSKWPGVKSPWSRGFNCFFFFNMIGVDKMFVQIFGMGKEW